MQINRAKKDGSILGAYFDNEADSDAWLKAQGY